MLESLPLEMQNAVNTHLGPGETVRWAGQSPVRRFYFTHVALAILGAWIVGQGIINSFSASGWNRAVGLAIATLGTILFFPLADAFVRSRQTVFAVTDRRAIILSLARGRLKTESFLPSDIQFRKKLIRHNGLGDLVFARVLKESKNQLHIGDAGFTHFPDVEGAEQAIEALLTSLQAAKPGDGAGGAIMSSPVLPSLLAKITKAELRPDEQIIWLELPLRSPGWCRVRDIFANAVGGVLLLSLMAGLPVLAFNYVNRVVGLWQGVLVAGFVVLLVLWLALWIWNERELGTVYLVTNIRALCVTAAANGRKVLSSLPGEIVLRRKIVRKNGSGHIYFLHECACDQGRRTENESGFECIANVALAEAALKQLAARCGEYPSHHESET